MCTVDIKSFFRVQCGLYVAAVGTPDKVNGCITNTLMQQSHVPVKLSLTLEKTHLTHDLILEKKSVGVSALSNEVTPALIKHFGFVTGRKVDKFTDFDGYTMDCNGNPVLTGEAVSATYSLAVYDTVDMGTHTMFLCTVDDSTSLDGSPITYWEYRESLKKK